MELLAGERREKKKEWNASAHLRQGPTAAGKAEGISSSVHTENQKQQVVTPEISPPLSRTPASLLCFFFCFALIQAAVAAVDWASMCVVCVCVRVWVVCVCVWSCGLLQGYWLLAGFRSSPFLGSHRKRRKSSPTHTNRGQESTPFVFCCFLSLPCSGVFKCL